MTALANQILQDGLKGTESWRKAEESQNPIRRQEAAPPETDHDTPPRT